MDAIDRWRRPRRLSRAEAITRIVSGVIEAWEKRLGKQPVTFAPDQNLDSSGPWTDTRFLEDPKDADSGHTSPDQPMTAEELDALLAELGS